jgi:cell division protease FtsH
MQDKKTKKMKIKSLQKKPNWIPLFWFLLFLLFALYMYGTPDSSKTTSIPYTVFKNKVRQGKVSEITVKGDEITGIFKEAEHIKPDDFQELEDELEVPTYLKFTTIMPAFEDSDLMGLLEKHNIVVKAKSKGEDWFLTLLIGVLPWLLIIGFFIYSSKKLGQSMKGGPFGFGKSKAKLYTKSSSNVTLKDVAGLANAKKEIQEIIDFLKDPKKYMSLGGELPKGVLLIGPPGTGKTLMARATAGEANVPFYSISGSEFIEMFVGVGAARVRDMFNNAKKDSPAIIFIDEIDSIGRVRGTGLGGGQDEREQTLNQILSEIDGFSPRESVIVMAATNRPDVLDPALVRPGRFDRQIILELPQKKARHEILQLHTRNKPLSQDLNLESVAERTVGFSGAELKNLVNEATLMAARKGKKQVDADDFEQARDKIIMGIEREDLINYEEKKVVAYHESGHALMSKLLPGADPLKKVSIIPRGRSLGATEQIPEENRHNLSRSYLLNHIAIMLGGRVAEKLVFRDITIGAGDDLKRVTQLARRMVRQWGMSERLGPIAFQRGDPHPFLGRDLAEHRDFSEYTAKLIDEEVQKLLQEMEKKAEKMLVSNRDQLDLLANKLLERESLSNEEVDELLSSLKSS